MQRRVVRNAGVLAVAAVVGAVTDVVARTTVPIHRVSLATACMAAALLTWALTMAPWRAWRGRPASVLVPSLVRNVAGSIVNWRAHRNGHSPQLALTSRYSHPFYDSGRARAELEYEPCAFDFIMSDYLRHAGRPR